MTNNISVEDLVEQIVKKNLDNNILFTALDISNEVKKTFPLARHRDIREDVRGLFNAVIEPHGWTRTPITVNLEDGSTAQALLYHSLADSWDLDNKYGAQQRAQVAINPIAVAQGNVALAQTNYQQTANSGAVVSLAPSQTAAQATVQQIKLDAPVIPIDPKTQWEQLFKSQPSLFPTS